MVAKTIRKAENKFTSRKFTLTCVVWGIGTLGWAFGYIGFDGDPIMTTEQWIKFSTWIIGLYMTGNVADKFVSKEMPVQEES